MDKFFWLELVIPIFSTALLYFAVKTLLVKLQKRGYRWGILFSPFALFFMVFVWMFVGRYFSDIQCQTAYGDLASDPKMCDNPALGFAIMLQAPILIVAWISISIFAIIKLKPLKLNSPAI